jgi:hypothetical protein
MKQKFFMQITELNVFLTFDNTNQKESLDFLEKAIGFSSQFTQKTLLFPA